MMFISKKYLVAFAFSVISISQIKAQTQTSTTDSIYTDQNNEEQSVVVKRKHSPKLATYLSAAVPGAGQVFNKKYWKVPIIYAGFAGGIYLNNYYNKKYQTYKNAYDSIIKIKNDTATLKINGKPLNTLQIQEGRNYYRKNRDLYRICIAVWYALNIVDACVDAYLFDYDMSDNLSLHISPDFNYYNKQSYYAGATLRFTLK